MKTVRMKSDWSPDTHPVIQWSSFDPGYCSSGNVLVSLYAPENGIKLTADGTMYWEENGQRIATSTARMEVGKSYHVEVWWRPVPSIKIRETGATDA